MILKVRDTVINKIDKNNCLHSLYILEWGTDNIQINKEKSKVSYGAGVSHIQQICLLPLFGNKILLEQSHPFV